MRTLKNFQGETPFLKKASQTCFAPGVAFAKDGSAITHQPGSNGWGGGGVTL